MTAKKSQSATRSRAAGARTAKSGVSPKRSPIKSGSQKGAPKKGAKGAAPAGKKSSAKKGTGSRGTKRPAAGAATLYDELAGRAQSIPPGAESNRVTQALKKSRPLTTLPARELLRTLRSARGPQLDAVAFLLLAVGTPKELPYLLAMIENEKASRLTLATVAFVLSVLRSNDAVQPLLTLLKKSPRALNRELSAYALTWYGPPQVADTLIDRLADKKESPAVRAQAAEGIGYHLQSQSPRVPRARRAVVELIDALDDRSPEVRFFSCFALGTMGVDEAIPALQRVARNDRALLPGWWYVHEEAKDAIKAIETGKWPVRKPVHDRKEPSRAKKSSSRKSPAKVKPKAKSRARA